MAVGGMDASGNTQAKFPLLDGRILRPKIAKYAQDPEVDV